jgi:hypothetical protein
MIGTRRTYMVEGGELSMDAGLTIYVGSVGIDQRGQHWFKPDFDERWRTWRKDDKANERAPIGVEFKRG